MRLFSILILFCFFGLISTDLNAGDKTKELDFARHLINRNELNEALFVLETIEPQSLSMQDSVFHLSGWVLYRQMKLKPSANLLLKVSENSPFYLKSRFFSAYNFSHINQAQKAEEILYGLKLDAKTMHGSMQNFQLSGLALLNRDFDGFEKRAEKFTGSFHAFVSEEKNMHRHYQRLANAPNRSPFVAGLLSTAIPGLGKIYAGKTAEGVVGFLYIAAMGLTAFDFYRGSGPQSALFISTASIAGIFYIGNIWGSVTTVNRQNREFNHEINQRILFDMHIPLRNAFN